MSLEKFLNIIDKTAIGRFVDYREELLKKTDPDRIYVENIRSFFKLPYKLAKFLCEQAVREGAFSKWRAFLCRNEDCQRVLLSTEYDKDEPTHVVFCSTCQTLEKERWEFQLDELEQMIFYKLND